MVEKASIVAQRLLDNFFENVETLPLYLERVLPDHAKIHVEQVFVAPSMAPSNLASGLDRLKRSIVGTRSRDDDYAKQTMESWRIPSKQDLYIGGSIAELVQQAQTRLFRAGAGVRLPSNMLTLGYKEADDRLEGIREVRMTGSLALTNFYVNSHVSSIILGMEWQHLLEQLGHGMMLHLLAKVALFEPVTGNEDNLIQILGQTLTELPELTTSSKDDIELKRSSVKRKRSRRGGEGGGGQVQTTSLSQPKQPLAREKTMQDRSKSDSVIALRPTKEGIKARQLKPIKLPTQQRKATEIQLVRNRIFYARPIRTRSGKVAAGLPMVHIFNRTTPKVVLLKRERRRTAPFADTKTSMGFKVDMKTKEERSRKVLKYIWPREHGLHNVLTGKLNRWKTSEKWQEYTNREEAIRNRGAMRTPKRLQTVSRLISILLTKHDRLDYGKLLLYCCPSSLPSTRLTAAERQEILIDLSEPGYDEPSTSASLACYTQPCATARIAASSIPASQHQGGRQIQHKPAFTKYKVATGSVSRFAQAVARKIFPIELLGSHHNLRLLLKNIDKFVRLRRHETLNLHHLCQGFRLLDCHWLLPRNKRALLQRPTESEMHKRQTLLYELLYYIFDSFLIPLLRTNFYATESAAFRNRIIYFRQDDWTSITLPILEKLKAGCFTTVSKNEAVGIMSGRDFGYSYVRLLPKLNGVRPIVNLRRRSVKIDRSRETTHVVQQQQSINNILNITFHVLNYEKKANLDGLGSSVFGAQDIYDKLQSYQSRILKNHNGTLPRLYFVKADVACAFDTIDQEKLLEIVQDIICHDRYIIQKFCQIMAKGDRASKSWPRVACAEDDQETFSKMIEEYSQEYNNVIFSDGVVYSHCERSKLMWLLEEHINNNLIKVGRDFCKQRVGIPQGSSLSTLLCCYYLARMEKNRKLCDKDDEESMLMRYTDDFLFISTSQAKAKQFYESIKDGDPSFNIKVAVEKSLHNLEVGVADEMSRLQGGRLKEEDASQMFPWCCYLINMKTLSVQYDMNRYSNTNLVDTLTINHKQPLQSLFKVVQSSIRNRNSCIFLDVKLNGIQVVITNLYQTFLLAAMKFLSCYREIKRIHGLRRNDFYILQSLVASLDFCYASVQGKMKRINKQQFSTTSSTESNTPSPWPIDRFTFQYLALHAFSRIFALRPSSRKWVKPLQSQLHPSARYQKAHHLYHQYTVDAWIACKSVITSVQV